MGVFVLCTQTKELLLTKTGHGLKFDRWVSPERISENTAGKLTESVAASQSNLGGALSQFGNSQICWYWLKYTRYWSPVFLLCAALFVCVCVSELQFDLLRFCSWLNYWELFSFSILQYFLLLSFCGCYLLTNGVCFHTGWIVVVCVSWMKWEKQQQHVIPFPQTGQHCIWATRPLLYFISGNKVEMEDFWAGAMWALKIWLYLIISLIMIPAMFGFSLGISETYMTILVKTLEVLSERALSHGDVIVIR